MKKAVENNLYGFNYSLADSYFKDFSYQETLLQVFY